VVNLIPHEEQVKLKSPSIIILSRGGWWDLIPYEVSEYDGIASEYDGMVSECEEQFRNTTKSFRKRKK
jgi:hypothetical protein